MKESPWPRIGWRNLGRNRKRTVLTALGLGVGYFACVFVVGWSEGIMAELVENATSLVTGQIEIHDAEYRPDRSLYDTIGGREGADVAALLRAIDADEAVVAAAPRVYAGGLVSSGEATSAGMFLGVDPEREVALTRFLDPLVAQARCRLPAATSWSSARRWAGSSRSASATSSSWWGPARTGRWRTTCTPWRASTAPGWSSSTPRPL